MTKHGCRPFVACLAFALSLFVSPVVAMPCGNRESVTAHLSGVYAEKLAGAGLETGGLLVEVWIAGDGETWTIFTTDANGMSCLLASGTDWHGVIVTPPGDPV